jgi:hypothetical protein
LTPASVNREMAFLKRVYNVAIRDGKRIDRHLPASSLSASPAEGCATWSTMRRLL